MKLEIRGSKEGFLKMGKLTTCLCDEKVLQRDDAYHCLLSLWWYVGCTKATHIFFSIIFGFSSHNFYYKAPGFASTIIFFSCYRCYPDSFLGIFSFSASIVSVKPV